ncbi:MMPL family transporter [Candidatus Saccharibacteria bacterium]|nr:MMPL family transporter [Candidatus Saccharibacteria bacterium]
MVKRIASFITKYCYVVFAVILVLAGLCAYISTKVKVNHDIYSYMPESSETAQGLQIMKDEFGYGETSSWQMMFEDLTDEKEDEIKEYLESVENVKSVVHDKDENYNQEKDGHRYSLYEITLNTGADTPEANKAYKEIYEHFKQEQVFSEAGEVYNNNATVISLGITALAVGTAMIILTVMSESFIEPWLYLFAILIAVLLNKGTNIMFENVSHITDGISMVLQMALSMDYAIMLSSRYRQERAKYKNKRYAMDRALRYSFGAIVSSSVTTVVGLIVLVFMSFTIGRDMGLVLSKGVVLSLVSIFTALPAMLLMCDKLIEKTKKKTPHLKLKWLGKTEYKFRKLVLPIFAALFIVAFFLKGDTAILFTASENNKIKDVFPAINQTAVVYENSEEKRMAEFCDKFAENEDTKRVICYSNTIGEEEKYNEIIAKVNELSGLKVSGQGGGKGEKVEVEDYLMKVMYYFYYREDKHVVSLPEFVRFVRDEVMRDAKFADEISDETRANIVRLSRFIVPEEAALPRSRDEVAELLGVPAARLDDLYTLYLSRHGANVRLTLNQFGNFVKNDVLTHPEYGGMVSAENRANLEKLLTFSDPDLPDKTTPENLLRFALTNKIVRNEMGVSEEDAEKAIQILNDAHEIIEPYKEKYPELRELLEPLEKEYSYSEYVEFGEKLAEMLKMLRKRAEEIAEKYEIEIDFSKIDEIDLEGKFEKLKLAEYVVDNRGRTYSSAELAETFGLNAEQLKLVYGLYDYRYVTGDPWLSLERVVDFLVNEVFTDSRYASRLDGEQKDKLYVVNDLMRNARMGTLYNYESLYSALTPLSDGIDVNQIFLMYLYHGSLYDYDENWTLSLEKFVNFLNEKVVTDARFDARINEEKRTTIAEAKVKVDDAKKMLVAEKHSRALVETELPAEGDETFNFLQSVKDEIGEGNKTQYFLVGDSAMAYEMSQSFGSEMDFITILTMVAIFVVVMFTFKSILIPLVLVLVIQSAVYINMAYLSLTGQSIYFIALIIVQAILMGATIDYAILYTSYYLEQRKERGVSVRQALIKAYENSIHSILTSASILILVTAIVGNMASAIAAKICQSISGGTLVATLIILLLLPALLATMDRFIVRKKK